MRLGRPTAEYPRKELAETLKRLMQKRGLRNGQLARLAGVNRGTVSHVLCGERPCSTQDRVALLKATGAPEELYAYFNCQHDAGMVEGETVNEPFFHGFLPDPVYFPVSDIFSRAFNFGGAARIEHLYFLEFQESIRTASMALKSIADFVHVDPTELLLHPAAALDKFSAVEAVGPAYTTINMLLFVLASAIIDRSAYDPKWLRSSKPAAGILAGLEEVHLILDKHDVSRDRRRQHGHLLRLKGLNAAVNIAPLSNPALSVPVAEEQLTKEVSHRVGADALMYLDEARQYLTGRDFDKALLNSDYGIALWHLGKTAAAEHWLLDALREFSRFGVETNPSLTLYALSKVAQRRLDQNAARSYAFLAGTLSPHGFLKEHARDCVDGLTTEEFLAELDNLKKFEPIAQVRAILYNQLAEEDAVTSAVINNLAAVFGHGKTHVVNERYALNHLSQREVVSPDPRSCYEELFEPPLGFDVDS